MPIPVGPAPILRYGVSKRGREPLEDSLLEPHPRPRLGTNLLEAGPGRLYTARSLLPALAEQ